MADILTTLLIGIVGATVLATFIYIGGFLVSMFISLFTAPYETVKHHNDHPMTI